MAGKGGKRPGAGRPKGKESPRSVAMREALELAFDGIGGVPKLTEWAADHLSEFYTLWIKLLPHQINGNLDLTSGGEKLVPKSWRILPGGDASANGHAADHAGRA